MRKLIIIVAAMLLVAGIQTAGAITASGIRWGEDLSSNQASNTLKQWTISIENRLGGAATAGTGNTYYVDSGVILEGDGKSWKNARNTLQEAVDLCTASNGDAIYVAQGTAETIASAGALALDCAGITIIGCGTGDQRPTYTVSTASTATITVTADDVYVHNVIIQSGKSDLATAIIVTADDFTLDHCTLRDSTAGLGMITIGAADGDSDRFCIANSYFYQPGTTNDHSIEVLFDMVGGIIANNTFYGDYDEGAIALPAGADACLDLIISGNVVYNKQASGKGISITNETSTGIVAGNSVYVDTYANGIDPGGLMDGGGNFISTAVNLAGISALPAPAIGTVTAGSAEDILKKLYYGNDGTGAYPATLANDSALAMIMAKGATATPSTFNNTTDSLEAIRDNMDTLNTADQVDLDAILADTALWDTTAELQTILFGSATPGATQAQVNKIDGATLATAPTAASLASFVASGGVALGTQLATSKSLVDAIGTNGTTVADTATGVAGMIGVNDADNAMDTSTVVSNPDGSAYERLEYQQKCAEVILAVTGRSVAGSAMPLAVWYVDGNIGASGVGTSPATAFKTIAEAITACSNSVDDWVLIYDFSGGGATLTINKSFVHLIGNAVKGMPYPRIKPASAVAGITFTDAGDRVEIANLVIGGGDQTAAAIDFAGCVAGAYGNYIHDCVIGRDADAPANDGISIPAGADAPYLVVENCRFYGTAMSGCDQSGIDIAGNCTGGAILNNYFADIGTSTNPAISLSGTVGNMQIEGNRIAGNDDTAAGWAITLSANCTNIWVDGNRCGSSDAAPDASGWLDSAADEANAWGLNYVGIVATLP